MTGSASTLLRGWLAAALVVSGFALARELHGRDLSGELGLALTATEDERIARALGLVERHEGWPEGHDATIWTIVAEHVPADGNVYVVGERNPRNAVTFSALQVLGYPRRFHELPAVPARDTTTGLSERDFVLDLEDASSPRLSGWFDSVARGEGFQLWRHPPATP